MILTDGVHLMSDESVKELHEFATKKLGLRRAWFQAHKLHPHYDLTTRYMFEKAIALGAEPVDSRTLVLKCSKRYT